LLLHTLSNLLSLQFPLSLSLSLRFNGHFPGGLAGTRMSSFWIILELRVIEVVVTSGTVRCAKLQSKCHHQQTNTQSLQPGCPFCHPTNSVKNSVAVKLQMYCNNILHHYFFELPEKYTMTYNGTYHMKWTK